MTDVAIIGAGLFGNIIARKLIRKGLNVAVFDNDEKKAGSKPAACLMKPSWFSSLGKEIYTPALNTLDELYDIKEIEFKAGPTKSKVKWIDPAQILGKRQFSQEVTGIKRDNIGWLIFSSSEGYIEKYTAKYIILAAGVWCNKVLEGSQLPSVPGLSPRTGTAMRIPGQTVPAIQPWAPFRQMVKFNITEDTIWVGDGTAYKNYDNNRLIKSLERCEKFAGVDTEVTSHQIGHRPYVTDAKPCYLKEHAPNLWVCTGGAKNGTIAAGWAAHELSKVIV